MSERKGLYETFCDSDSKVEVKLMEKLKHRLDKLKEEGAGNKYIKWELLGFIRFHAERDEITASQLLELLDEYFFER